MISLPEKYEQRMKILLGEEYEKYIGALGEKPVRALRVNTDKISTEDFLRICPFPVEKIPYVENGFYFDLDGIGNHPFHHAGMFYIQEPAAMVPVESVDIDPNWKVLDLCAAPGGKSSQIKNKLGEKGVLVSNEIVPSRCKILTSNVERLGLKNVITTCMDSERIARLYPKTFDFIMVDAPCSGEGMFRKEQIAIDEWSKENVEKCAARQMEILENATKCLKNGGYIVYATCTFSLEENEMLIDEFLSNHPEFELVRVNEEVEKNTSDGIFFDGCKCENITFTRRVYPHKNKGEGQFMAVVRKEGDWEPSSFGRAAQGKKKKGGKDAKGKNQVQFEKGCNYLPDNYIKVLQGDLVKGYREDLYERIRYVEENLKTVLSGIAIAEKKGKDYIPHADLALTEVVASMMASLSLPAGISAVEVGREDALKFLAKEPLLFPDAPMGYLLLVYCGLPLGFVKNLGNRSNNLLPMARRIRMNIY